MLNNNFYNFIISIFYFEFVRLRLIFIPFFIVLVLFRYLTSLGTESNSNTLDLFKNRYLAYFGTILLYTTPRIFAHSFYNGKDLAFLSFFSILISKSVDSVSLSKYKSNDGNKLFEL